MSVTSVEAVSSLLKKFLESEDDDTDIDEIKESETEIINENKKMNQKCAQTRAETLLSIHMNQRDLPQRPKREKRRKRNKNKIDIDDEQEMNSQSKQINRKKREIKYEYLDHTADVQLHSWGITIKEAFEQIGISMFGYMTDLATVECKKSFVIECKAYDLHSLLFQFLNELLVVFSCEEYLLFRDIEIIEFNAEDFVVKAIGFGENMDLKKHPQGTEVKAITYSAMQILQTSERVDLYVVVDI